MEHCKEIISEQNEKLFDLQEEINRLRNQVTYLQEELYSVEDAKDKMEEQYEIKIEALEQQLGDALFGRR